VAATMQWGYPQPRSGEGDEAMRRSDTNGRGVRH
jgi:hypothetical protein